jgi:hypothetical protein
MTLTAARALTHAQAGANGERSQCTRASRAMRTEKALMDESAKRVCSKGESTGTRINSGEGFTGINRADLREDRGINSGD